MAAVAPRVLVVLLAARSPARTAVARLARTRLGLDDLRQIIQVALPHLKPGGCLLLEHGYDQKAAVVQLLQQAGYQHDDDNQYRDGRQAPAEVIELDLQRRW